MQTLHAMALSPIAETWADPHSYGFRQGRSCARDAVIASNFSQRKRPDGSTEYRDLIKAGWTPIVRHTKVRGEAHSFDQSFEEYFASRKRKKKDVNQDGRFVLL
jgi:hypothetical protein